jgi:small-conductance mechanosensitive channel
MKYSLEKPKKNNRKELIFIFLAFGILICFTRGLSGQESKAGDPELQSVQLPVAPVQIDGNLLFNVRGISTYTAEQRAAAISKRIRTAASDRSISTDSVKIIPTPDYYSIYAGKLFIMNAYSVDADNEKIKIETLSQLVKQKTVDAMVLFRLHRSPNYLIRKSITALGSLILFTLILFLIIWLFRKIDILFQKKMKSSIDTLENKSFSLIRAHQLWKIYHGAIRILRIIIIILLVVFATNYLLGLFPWTNNAAIFTLNLITDPVLSIAEGLLNFIPNLAFLVVIYFVTRYLLKLGRLLFNGLKRGEITIRNFDPDWALPTFRILRIFVIAFAVVLAYPYIPGSDSSAFKGISVFMGVLFSFGSSSFISNIIAGYTITYRRAFKTGDRIRVGDQEGFVEEQKVLVTRLLSIKNEEIVIPNSLLLNSNIINYSAKARESGLIIHAEVGIGYETPWRQVEAMLIEAADRTEGIKKQPAPFVLQLSLGDFAVTYQVNVYCSDASKLESNYTNLYHNVLDVFNENNIQIMTPAYINDPATAKVVPEKLWNPPLAKKK